MLFNSDKMEQKYNLREVTPKSMQCLVGTCNSIYEITPKSMQCSLVACNSIYNAEEDYLIIGKQVNPSEFGLKGKVGEGEILIRVPKNLIDNKEK